MSAAASEYDNNASSGSVASTPIGRCFGLLAGFTSLRCLIAPLYVRSGCTHRDRKYLRSSGPPTGNGYDAEVTLQSLLSPDTSVECELQSTTSVARHRQLAQDIARLTNGALFAVRRGNRYYVPATAAAPYVRGESYRPQ